MESTLPAFIWLWREGVNGTNGKMFPCWYIWSLRPRGHGICSCLIQFSSDVSLRFFILFFDSPDKLVRISTGVIVSFSIEWLCLIKWSYRITRNFRENLIFAIFANDLKTWKYVSAKNCTLKESLEVGTSMIFLLHTFVIVPCYTDFNVWINCLVCKQLRIEYTTIIIIHSPDPV